MLTRGCPRCNHTFCITPIKDGCISHKVFNLRDFWDGQKNVVLLDQNILACKDRIDLLNQLEESKARISFNGGLDVRYMTEDILQRFKRIRVKDYFLAWDDPTEDLLPSFKRFKESGLRNPGNVNVYVLTNFWSSTEEDLYRIYSLRKLGFMPFVMIYDKQKFVDDRGRWLPGVEDRYTVDQLRHFKTCQHLQRWCGCRRLIKAIPDFLQYDPYKRWMDKGKPVPERKV